MSSDSPSLPVPVLAATASTSDQAHGHLVLARKLRPQRFADLLGQDTTAQALKNAVISERVAHALLFTGSRGLGKTSAARILSKAINCLSPQEGEPCGQCELCDEITRGVLPDIQEIDAASNRGIDNIRELRENARYQPAKARYKVYIIDEAHMLTGESFNALLKILEEPPPHIKFILATTDSHRMPETILSRCQRFDFLRVSQTALETFLKEVAAKEGFNVAEPTLVSIARNAHGGLRDALTALEQVVLFADAADDHHEALSLLNLMDSHDIWQLLDAVLAQDLPSALKQFHQRYQQGVSIESLLQAMLQEIRHLSLYQVLNGNISPSMDIPSDAIAHCQRWAPTISTDLLQQLFYLLLELEGQMRHSRYAKVCFEIALIKACRLTTLAPLAEILTGLERLSNQTPVLAVEQPAGKANLIQSNVSPTSAATAPESPTTSPVLVSSPLVSPALVSSISEPDLNHADHAVSQEPDVDHAEPPAVILQEAFAPTSYSPAATLPTEMSRPISTVPFLALTDSEALTPISYSPALNSSALNSSVEMPEEKPADALEKSTVEPEADIEQAEDLHANPSLPITAEEEQKEEWEQESSLFYEDKPLVEANIQPSMPLLVSESVLEPNTSEIEADDSQITEPQILATQITDSKTTAPQIVASNPESSEPAKQSLSDPALEPIVLPAQREAFPSEDSRWVKLIALVEKDINPELARKLRWIAVWQITNEQVWAEAPTGGMGAPNEAELQQVCALAESAQLFSKAFQLHFNPPPSPPKITPLSLGEAADFRINEQQELQQRAIEQDPQVQRILSIFPQGHIT